MKVSLNWIKEFTTIVLPPEELRERISVSLTEVESIEHFGDRFKSIIVAEVTKVEKHPVSDTLLILDLNTGGRNVKVVVQHCQIKVGDKVPFLPPGTTIPGEIGSNSATTSVFLTTIKGVRSEGMVPSGREIGLNHDHTTVYILPADAKVGASINQTLDLTDIILEIKNKPLTHRPDVFSIEGFAREVSAIQRTPYKPLAWLQSWDSLTPRMTQDLIPMHVTNQAKALCPRYMAVVMDNVVVGPSPKWMQVRLAKVGIRPVNNVVDISNYLMIESGQPSHAFDYDKIIEKDPASNGCVQIIVRLALGGEKITTIDGLVHELHSDTVVIADSVHPIGIAGVMGGKDTEITDNTKRVIFQIENLDMYNVRKSSMKLGIFSEAVTRFSRGLDPNRCEPVLYKGMQMLEELAGATQASSVKDCYEMALRSKSITISPDWIRNRIGFSISDSEMETILRSLGLQITSDRQNATKTVAIPTFRRDLVIQEDIEEEIVRIYGFDKITPTLPTRSIVPVMMSVNRRKRSRLKEILAASGSHEVYTYSFVGPDLFEASGLELAGAYKLRNAVSPDLSYMRPLLLPSLIEKAALNKESFEEFSLFEVDMVNPLKPPIEDRSDLPDEPWHVALVHSVSFYHAKAFLEELLVGLHVDGTEVIPWGQTEASELQSWIRYAQSSYNLTRTACIRIRGEVVGLMGQLSTEVSESFGVDVGIAGFEIKIDDLNPFISDVAKYRNPSRFPSVVHDLCFVAKTSIPYRAFEKAILNTDPEHTILKNIKCRDIYVNESKPDEKKTTYRIVLQSDNKTLTDDDVAKVRKQIIESVLSATGARLAG